MPGLEFFCSGIFTLLKTNLLQKNPKTSSMKATTISSLPVEGSPVVKYFSLRKSDKKQGKKVLK